MEFFFGFVVDGGCNTQLATNGVVKVLVHNEVGLEVFFQCTAHLFPAADVESGAAYRSVYGSHIPVVLGGGGGKGKACVVFQYGFFALQAGRHFTGNSIAGRWSIAFSVGFQIDKPSGIAVVDELVQRLPGIFGRDSCPVGNTCFFQKFVHQQDETGGSIVCTVFHIPVIAVLVEVVHQFLIAPSFGLTGFEGFGYFAFPSAAQTGPVGAGSLHGGTCVICHQFWIGVGI